MQTKTPVGQLTGIVTEEEENVVEREEVENDSFFAADSRNFKDLCLQAGSKLKHPTINTVDELYFTNLAQNWQLKRR